MRNQLLVFVLVTSLFAPSLLAESNKQRKAAPQVQQVVPESKVPTWIQEPETFAGLSLLNRVDIESCPQETDPKKKSYIAEVFELSGSKWDALKKSNMAPDVCVAERASSETEQVRPPNWRVATGTYYIWVPKKHPPILRGLRVGFLDGHIMFISSKFPTDEYNELSAILAERYGVAHEKGEERLQTNSGAYFPNYTQAWHGKRLHIIVQSLVSRDLSIRKDRLESWGEFRLVTKEFLDLQEGENAARIKEKASTF